MMQRAFDAATKRAVRVGTVGVPPLLTAGLAALLVPYQDRVSIIAPDLLEFPLESVPPIDVALCDPRDRTAMARVADLRTLRPLPVLEFSGVLGRPHLHPVSAQFEVGRLPIDLDAEGLIDALTHTARSGKTGPASAMDGYSETAYLSPRELQMLELVCSGLTNLEIASELFLSVNSVKTYIRALYRKIGVTRRSQCVAWGMALGRSGSPTDARPVDSGGATPLIG